MNRVKLFENLSAFLVVVTVLASIFYYDQLPSTIITHWNFAGEPDGYSSKSFLLPMMPIIIALVYFLFHFLPFIDPRKENYKKFKTEYKMFQLVIVAFLTILYFIVIYTNLGYNLQIGLIVPIMIAIMFIFFGGYIKNIKPNWFIGIKTPWTLSSERVWIKTHEYGSKVFIAAGVLFFLVPFMPADWAFAFLSIVIVLILSTILYSYMEYKHLKK